MLQEQNQSKLSQKRSGAKSSPGRPFMAAILVIISQPVNKTHKEDLKETEESMKDTGKTEEAGDLFGVPH